MPRQNRVSPEAEITDADWRGGFTGNRGILHGADGRLGAARWRQKAWITCTIRPRPGRGSLPMAAPGHYTPLFFTDEAVACAAGHRPCAECRRPAFTAFCAAWQAAFGTKARAPLIDAALHAARLQRPGRQQCRLPAPAATLPDGAFCLLDAKPHLIWGDAARSWQRGQYGPARPRPDGLVTVLTPAPMLAVLAAGWRPVLQPAEDRPGW